MSDFEEVALTYIQKQINETFDEYGVKYDVDDDPRSAIVNYFSWIYRWIPERPRIVTISQHLTDKIENESLNEDTKGLIQDFKEKFEKGESMNEHLSKFAHRTDKDDYLRYCWKIYHLHLAEGNARSGEQLLAAINKDEVLFIDVITHPARGQSQEYFKLDYLRVLRDSGWFPKVGIGGTSNIRPENLNWIPETDEDFYNLYKSHVNIQFVIDGVVYGSMGVMMSGQPFKATWTFKTIMKNIRKCDQEGVSCDNVQFMEDENGMLMIIMDMTLPDGKKEVCDLLTGARYT